MWYCSCYPCHCSFLPIMVFSFQNSTTDRKLVLGDRLGMHASWMTILRRVMACPSASVEQVVQLGIDDFSFRRGRTFGTILVDMQSHQVIDLLADRKVETV